MKKIEKPKVVKKEVDKVIERVEKVEPIKEPIKLTVPEKHEGKEVIGKRNVVINGKEYTELTLSDGSTTIL